MSTKILHKQCFYFLLRLTQVPGENKNNAYATFWRTKTIMVFLKVAYWNSFITYPKWTLTNAKKDIFVILKTYLRYPFYILTLTSFQVWLQLVCHRKRPLVLSRCPGSFLLSRSYSLFSQSDHPVSFVAVLKNNKCFTTVKWKQGK